VFRQSEGTAFKNKNAVIPRLDRAWRWPAAFEQILSECQTKCAAADDDCIEGTTRFCLAERIAES
jgi:hypothetical protein